MLATQNNCQPNADVMANSEQVKLHLRSHLQYLFTHKLYIERINKNEVSDEDIEAYAKDVFGLNINASTFKNQLIIPLTLTIKERLDTCLLLNKIMGLDSKVAAVCLYFYLKYLIAVNNASRKISKEDNISLCDKAQFTFNDNWLLIQLKTIIKKQLPCNTETLSGLYEIKDNTRAVSPGAAVLDVIFKFKLKNIFEDISSSTKRLLAQCEKAFAGGLSTKSNSKSAEKQPYLDEMLNKLQNLAATYQMINQQLKNADMQDQSIFVQNLIDFSKFFIKTQDTFSEIKALHTRATQELEFLVESDKYIQGVKNKIAIQENLFNIAEKKFNKIAPEQSNSSLLTDIKNSFFLLKNLSIKNFNTRDEFVELKSDILFAFKSLYRQLEELNKLNAHLKNLPQAISQNKTAEKVTIPCSEKQPDSSERTTFLLEQAEKTEKYKKEVQKRREEKNQLKKTQTTVSRNNADTEQLTPVIVYKNAEMDVLLKALSSKKLQLITSILKVEKGIKYDDVYHLICNKLNGQITEIGNGSSHKRMQIAKYLVEVTTSCTFDPMQISKQVGSVQKPHGDSHNSGLLSRFNVETVKRLFTDAGITLAQIEQLEKSKSGALNFFSTPQEYSLDNLTASPLNGPH